MSIPLELTISPGRVMKKYAVAHAPHRTVSSAAFSQLRSPLWRRHYAWEIGQSAKRISSIMAGVTPSRRRPDGHSFWYLFSKIQRRSIFAGGSPTPYVLVG